MRVYGVANLDGLTEAMVMAPNLAAAASALGVDAAQMRKLGWTAVRNSAAALARRAEGRPVYRAVGGSGKWTEDRSAALAQAARAAIRREPA